MALDNLAPQVERAARCKPRSERTCYDLFLRPPAPQHRFHLLLAQQHHPAQRLGPKRQGKQATPDTHVRAQRRRQAVQRMQVHHVPRHRLAVVEPLQQGRGRRRGQAGINLQLAAIRQQHALGAKAVAQCAGLRGQRCTQVLLV